MDFLSSVFELLFKYRPVVFQRGQLAFAAPYPIVIALAVALLGAALVWTYTRARGKSTRRDRAVLAALRVAVIGLIGICLLRPTLLISAAVPQKNVLAILVDDSRSMQIADEGGQSRADAVRRLVGTRDSALARALAERFQLRYLRFSSTAEQTPDAAELAFAGPRTNLGAALDRARQELTTDPLSGIVVLSDGADNSSSTLAEPLLALRARGIPVYTVGVGSEQFGKDVEITRVDLPGTALRGTALVATVMLSQRGYGGQTVRLVAEDGGRIVATQDVKLRGDGEEAPVRMRVVAGETGARQLRFRVAPLAGELIAENNERDALVTVTGGKEKILYVEGEPRFELKFIRRAIRDDENVQVVALQRTAENKYLRLGVDDSLELVAGFPRSREELFRYRAIILGSVEASFFTVEQLRMLADFVGERGGGLLLLGGRRSFAEGGYAGTPLADVMPVELPRNADADGSPEFFEELHIAPTPAGAAHPATQLGANEEASATRWRTMPALSTVNRIATAKPGATSLLIGQPPSGGRQVVLAYQRFGRGKAIAFPVQDSWLWQMHASVAVDDATHETFWRQMLRWLASDVPDRLAVRPSTDRVAPGEPVALRAEVRSESFLAVNGATVSATVTDPLGESRQLPLEWVVDKDGEYRGAWVAEHPGIYRIALQARLGDSVLSARESYVLARELQQELFGATQRAALLRRIADETGGRYYTVASAAALARDVIYTSSGTTVIEQAELWDMPILFILLLVLAGAEWGWRRARGLA